MRGVGQEPATQTPTAMNIQDLTPAEREALTDALDQFVTNGRDAENLDAFAEDPAGLARVEVAERLLDQLNEQMVLRLLGTPN